MQHVIKFTYNNAVVATFAYYIGDDKRNITYLQDVKVAGVPHTVPLSDKEAKGLELLSKLQPASYQIIKYAIEDRIRWLAHKYMKQFCFLVPIRDASDDAF